MASHSNKSLTDSLDIMRTALRSLLKDSGFKVSTSGIEAQHSASEMLEGLDAAEDPIARALVHKIVNSLASCVSKRSTMWGLLHQTRTSTQFIATWEELMTITLHKIASPILYQYITDVLFKELVKQQYPLPVEPTESWSMPPLDYQEHNAVRYAAGYVVRNLQKHIEKGFHPLKEELVLYLENMCEDVDDMEDNFSASAEWAKHINRGGLKLVSDHTYEFFLAVEMRLRQFLCVTRAQNISDGTKATLMEDISRDENVLFSWAILGTEWKEEVQKALLLMVIELWITVRGFSFAKSFLEMYKQANQKTVQKSKGLRKKLIK